jgi:DNA (cytosine-5)-methyltransferase 1
VVDLFAGVGGLSFGFAHHDDFVVVAANEILAPMAAAYRANHPETRMYESDISHLSGRELSRDLDLRQAPIDIVVGGPPCQAYSTVGKRLLDDPRAHLFQEYFRLVKELKPSLFVYENVKGLLSMNEGQLLPSIVSLFGSVGYEVHAALLNAADFGVPQIRERVIVVGTRDTRPFRYPTPTHQDPSTPASLLSDRLAAWRTLRDAISDLPEVASGETASVYRSEPDNEYQELMRKSAPPLVMDHVGPTHGQSLMRIIEALPEGGGQKDLPDGLQPKSGFPNTYARLWWDRPATTITRNLGTPSSSRCIHPRAHRGLTTREGARLQSFPDHFSFAGSRSERNLQVGNAVPPLLSAALAHEVFAYLNSNS